MTSELQSNSNYVQHLQSRYTPQSRTVIEIINALANGDKIIGSIYDDDVDLSATFGDGFLITDPTTTTTSSTV